MKVATLGGGTTTLSLGGQNINLIPLSSTANYTLFGGDISAFAGQVDELKISANFGATNHFYSIYLDDITFSTSPVPEPGTGALLVCGTILFGLNRRRRRG
jgi:hypothetical protein